MPSLNVASPVAGDVASPVVADDVASPVADDVSTPVGDDFASTVVADDVASPVADDVASLVADDVTSPVAASPVADDVTSPVADDVISPVAADVTTPVADDVTSPVADDVTSPVADDVTSPVADDVTSPVAADVTTPVADDVTSPVADDVTSPVADDVTTPVADDVTSPVADDVTSPVAADVTTPVADDVTTPVADDVTSPVADDVTSPAADDVTSPVAANVALPVAADVVSPVADGYATLPAHDATTSTADVLQTFVLSGLRISEDMKQAFLRISKTSGKGFIYSETFSSAVTHVIMHNDPCDRSWKYLQGLAHRCWILHSNWIFESVQAGYLLPEMFPKHNESGKFPRRNGKCLQRETQTEGKWENYEIKRDNVASIPHIPNKARLSATGIFNNLQIFVEDTKTYTSIDIPDLILAGSGAISTLDDCDLILINKENDDITPDDAKLLQEYAARYRKRVVTLDWLFDSVSTWKLQEVAEYNITTDRTVVSDEDENFSSEEDDTLDPLYQPSDSDSDEVVDNSAESDTSEIFDAMDLKNLKTTFLEDKRTLKLSKTSTQNENLIGQRSITVKSFSKSEEGKKVWDKKHYCMYCNKAFAKLPRHLESKHQNETEIIKLRSLDRRNKQQKAARLILIDKLRKRGDYNHNVDVLSSGKGEVVTKKSLSKVKKEDEYLPCKYCFAFYLKCDLYRHVNRCILREQKTTKGARHQSNSVFLLPSCLTQLASVDFQKDVVADMAVDNVSLCARNDNLIIAFGEKLYKKHKALPHMRQYIRTRMRELARFLLQARVENKDVQCLSECISPKNFQICIRAVQSLCGIDNGNKADIPSLALKIGHSLSKCANILISEALVQSDVCLQEKAEGFLKLYSMEWNTEVSATALKSLETAKWNKPSLLPLTNDIVKFQNYLDKQIELNMSLLQEKKTQGWRILCESLLITIILFNRRRSGEVEKITLDVLNQKSKSKVSPDVMETLNSLEKYLVTSLTRVEVRGKKGRKVPILLPEKVNQALDELVRCRGAAGIENKNPFVFANNALGYVRGADCMRHQASAAQLEHPENIRSTNLRKHVATLSQVVNLKDNELDVLAQFLGHDVNVHRNFYRLPEDTLQIAKAGKLLMAVNKGTMKKYAGKSLDDINIQTDEEVSAESESESGSGLEEHVDKQRLADSMSSNEKHLPCSGSEENEIEESLGLVKKNRKRFAPRKWSLLEIEAVDRTLGKFLKQGQLPGKSDCVQAKQKEPVLQHRSWEMIKQHIRNRNKRVTSAIK